MAFHNMVFMSCEIIIIIIQVSHSMLYKNTIFIFQLKCSLLVIVFTTYFLHFKCMMQVNVAATIKQWPRVIKPY